jgi:5-methylcytosine-specific restriction endonuclease McrA
MTRPVPEWIGKTPTTPIPPRVKLRIIERCGGKCYLTGDDLVPGQIEFEHVLALVLGGENRESNIATANRPAHKFKTCKDVFEKTKRAKSLKKKFGLGGSKWKRKVSGETVLRYPSIEKER